MAKSVQAYKTVKENIEVEGAGPRKAKQVLL